MSEEQTIHTLILSQLERSDDNQRRIFEKLDEQGRHLASMDATMASQGRTVLRLTETVEEHKNYSRNLELEQKEQRLKLSEIDKELTHVDSELAKVNLHITEVNLWVKLIKPTKTKIAAVALLVSLLGGNEALKSPLIKRLIQVYTGVPISHGIEKAAQ